MNPLCARCNKPVYPTERLNCLDKVWHKGCFKCEVCGMTLTMKNYKGYMKKPYCNAHYPTTKFTAVADTPENMRLKKNTTNQSSVVYQKDFNKDKGKFTAVSDDPETMRAKKTQMQASDLKYHEDFEQTKGQFTAVADDPELLRTRKTQQQASDSAYKERQADLPPAEQPQLPPSASRAPPPEPEPEPLPEYTPEPEVSGAPRYIALYDYTAADDDEVSFQENDIIINGEEIDEGWMTGTVERTGETGMLPSNYVEKQ